MTKRGRLPSLKRHIVLDNLLGAVIAERSEATVRLFKENTSNKTRDCCDSNAPLPEAEEAGIDLVLSYDTIDELQRMLFGLENANSIKCRSEPAHVAEHALLFKNSVQDIYNREEATFIIQSRQLVPYAIPNFLSSPLQAA